MVRIIFPILKDLDLSWTILAKIIILLNKLRSTKRLYSIWIILRLSLLHKSSWLRAITITLLTHRPGTSLVIVVCLLVWISIMISSLKLHSRCWSSSSGVHRFSGLIFWFVISLGMYSRIISHSNWFNVFQLSWSYLVKLSWSLCFGWVNLINRSWFSLSIIKISHCLTELT